MFLIIERRSWAHMAKVSPEGRDMNCAHRSIRMRLAPSTWALLLCLVAHTAFGCSPGAIDRKELMKSDVIATGTLHIIKETKQQNGSETVTEGIAELRARRVFKNRTAPAARFTFRYKQTKFDGCLFGEQPLEGSTVKVYLSRLSPGADDLGLFHIEWMEH